MSLFFFLNADIFKRNFLPKLPKLSFLPSGDAGFYLGKKNFTKSHFLPKSL